MPRPPLAVGTFGKIGFLVLGQKRVRARASFRDFDGRRRFVTRYGETRAQAERRLRAALRDRAGPSDDGTGADSRLSSLASLWLADVDDSDLAAGTKRLYRFAVQNYVPRPRRAAAARGDRAGRRPLLTAVRKNHGPAAAKVTRSVLSGVLGEAVRRGALATNPVRDASPRRSPRQSVKRPRALTRDEANQLLERLAGDSEADHLDLADLVEFMLGTGVRIGEACALRWSAVDLDAGTLRVEATLIRIPRQGLAIQDFPKTTAGRRTIALPAFVVDLLRRRQAAPRLATGAEVVFPSPTGRLRDPHNTSANLRRVLARADFAWVTSHVFRKTVATRLDEAGLSARQIADHLGHNRPSLTQDVYLGRGLASPEAAAALQRLR